MIKHGVVMVTLLILTLSLLGVVSASDITASDVDTQSINQEDTRVEVVETAVDSVDDVEVSASISSSDDKVSAEDISSDGDKSLVEDVSSDGDEPWIEDISSDEGLLDEEAVSIDENDDVLSYGESESYSSYGESEYDVKNTDLISLSSDLIMSGEIDDGFEDVNYILGYDVTTSAGKLLDFESADDILVIVAVDSVKINNVAIRNVLNGIIDASNGYVAENGNLITLSSLKSDLIDIAFFIRKCESLTMAFYKNGAITSICSGDESSVNPAGLWNDLSLLLGEDELIGLLDSWTNGDLKGILSGEYQGYFASEQLFEQNMIQTLLGCNNELGLSFKNSKENLLGVPRDTNDNAVIWYWDNVSDKISYIGVDSSKNESLSRFDMENNTSENGMITELGYNKSNSNEMLKIENKLNPYKTRIKSSYKLTSADIKQIGVDASKKAIAYFKSRGINVKKDYENFYILTSAGFAKINGVNTIRAIDGIIEVFGTKIIKNMYLIDTSIWKDLIFYFIWVNSADEMEFISYSLKYDIGAKKLIVDSKSKEQGDNLAYLLGLYAKGSEPDDFPSRGYLDLCPFELVIKDKNNTNNTKLSNATKASDRNRSNNVSLPESKLPKARVNPYNIAYTLVSMFMVCSIFGVSYSKR